MDAKQMYGQQLVKKTSTNYLYKKKKTIRPVTSLKFEKYCCSADVVVSQSNGQSAMVKK